MNNEMTVNRLTGAAIPRYLSVRNATNLDKVKTGDLVEITLGSTLVVVEEKNRTAGSEQVYNSTSLSITHHDNSEASAPSWAGAFVMWSGQEFGT